MESYKCKKCRRYTKHRILRRFAPGYYVGRCAKCGNDWWLVNELEKHYLNWKNEKENVDKIIRRHISKLKPSDFTSWKSKMGEGYDKEDYIKAMSTIKNVPTDVIREEYMSQGHINPYGKKVIEDINREGGYQKIKWGTRK